MQVEPPHQPLESRVARRAGRAHLQPVRLGLTRLGGDGRGQRNDAGHFSVLYRSVALFHHIDLRVMWSDTDPAGIVWFGVFFRYFEHAEEDLYRRLGSDRTALLRRLNIFMPRTSLQSGFRSPARLGDEIAVGVGIGEMTDRRIGFTFDIHEPVTARPISEAS